MTDEGVDEAKRDTLRRFAAIGSIPLAGFTTQDQPSSTGSLSRDAIRGYLRETPGAHFSKLRDDLQLGTGEAQHHLQHLLDANEIESLRDGDYRRFYPYAKFSDEEQQLLAYLRRPTARAVILTLLTNPDSAVSEIATTVDVSTPTVSTWTTRLTDDEILVDDDGYKLQTPEIVLVLLLRYADSFGDDVAALSQDAANLIEYSP